MTTWCPRRTEFLSATIAVWATMRHTRCTIAVKAVANNLNQKSLLLFFSFRRPYNMAPRGSQPSATTVGTALVALHQGWNTTKQIPRLNDNLDNDVCVRRCVSRASLSLKKDYQFTVDTLHTHVLVHVHVLIVIVNRCPHLWSPACPSRSQCLFVYLVYKPEEFLFLWRILAR